MTGITSTDETKATKDLLFLGRSTEDFHSMTPPNTSPKEPERIRSKGPSFKGVESAPLRLNFLSPNN